MSYFQNALLDLKLSMKFSSIGGGGTSTVFAIPRFFRFIPPLKGLNYVHGFTCRLQIIVEGTSTVLRFQGFFLLFACGPLSSLLEIIFLWVTALGRLQNLRKPENKLHYTCVSRNDFFVYSINTKL